MGYHQLLVRAQNIGKTAVIMPFGTYEYLHMPFGLRNPSQTFQRLMMVCWLAYSTALSTWMTC
jgi:hypothetical protein